MRQTLLATAQYLPFIGLAMGKIPHNPLITRLLEVALVAGIIIYDNKQDIEIVQENQREIQRAINDMQQKQIDLQIIIARMHK